MVCDGPWPAPGPAPVPPGAALVLAGGPFCCARNCCASCGTLTVSRACTTFATCRPLGLTCWFGGGSSPGVVGCVGGSTGGTTGGSTGGWTGGITGSPGVVSC